jgi:hypothetical protein
MSAPAPLSSSQRVLAWLGPALVHAGLAIAIVVRVLWAGPRCQQFVDDMKIQPHALTQAVLAVSAWVGKYFYVVLIALVPALAGNTLLLWQLSEQSAQAARRWFWIGGCLLCLAWAVLEAGYFLSLM